VDESTLFRRAIPCSQHLSILPSNETLKHHYCEARSIDHSIIRLNPWSPPSRDRRPIGDHGCPQQWRQLLSQVQDTTQPMTKISYDQSRWVQNDSNDSQRLQSTTGHHRCCDCTLKVSIHDGNLDNSETNWHTTRVTVIEEDDHEYRTRSIEYNRQPKHLEGTEWSYPWMAPYREPRWSQRRFPRQHGYNYNPSISAKCTYFSLRVHLRLQQPRRSRLAEAFYSQSRDTLLERSIPTEEHQPTHEALLLLSISAQAQCTSGEDTQKSNDVEDDKLSLDWSEHIAGIHCAAWSAFTVSDQHNSAHHLQQLRPLQWLRWLGRHLWAHVLWRIEVHLPFEWFSTTITLFTTAEIDKSSANDLLTLSQQKNRVAGAGNNGDSGWKC